jgi:hypothetical protein
MKMIFIQSGGLKEIARTDSKKSSEFIFIKKFLVILDY